ncbi:ABC transporter ATP-binding protein [Histidinibacterium aquaticum]|uniref:ABC transporter ATP-binding protein n=1 Tax=Histidinibacterium aquaticum TaxID=2613962 RepID=A0A5J5GKF0_9RHOB|nr:ABC transporter ATP-binding protein [Histidinibacterium aquaticum]KAA9008108.1 ABC transporter ATP-binding protein [Histidinibacterium aquaticum]
MFEITGLQSGYGGVTILKDVALSADREVYAVLGANGAGKSTLLKTLAGIIRPTAGEIRFNGERIDRLPAHKIAALGIGYVPQENCVFPDLTVAENLSIGGILGKRSKADRLAELYDLFPDLQERLDQKAGSLSGGEGQMVAIGRALMQEPSVLLLDEPTAGLSPRYTDLLFRRVAEISREKQVTVVLAEQNVTSTLGIARKVHVLSLGKTHLQGATDEVSIEQVRQGYHI